MTNEQLKKLEDELWASANSLRAYGGIKASDYAVPVLGLIFLRFADNKYSQYEAEINRIYEIDEDTRLHRELHKVAIAICGFYLPKYARYDYLLKLPKEEKMAEALQKAMQGIEEYQDEKFKDVLPKAAYFDIEKKKDDILPELLKKFANIPKDASGDVFGKIYEYFLGNFAKSEGQKGGEFFTPTSVVRFIVEVIEPYAGKIFDPACGSGGMFVQSAKFVQNAKHDLSDIYVYGQEYMGETARLAKLNLMVNNIRGEITEVNSYESNPYESLGKFDFVMANPPFNVKSVKVSTVKNDERFYQFGLPKNKGKSTEQEESITDANYLWVSLFATSLNDTGRAGFVMPNSASDAGNSEYDIRKKLVDSDLVDCMVSMPSNMFLTVTLPATLWFFDKQKAHSERKGKILFLDARNVFTQIDRAHREWKEEQVQNLSAIVRLYRGETERYLELLTHYAQEANLAEMEILPKAKIYQTLLQETLANLQHYAKHRATKSPLFPDGVTTEKVNNLVLEILTIPVYQNTLEITPTGLFGLQNLHEYLLALKNLDDTLKTQKEALCDVWAETDKNLKLKSDKFWADLVLNNALKNLEEAQQNFKITQEKLQYWNDNLDWLQSRFPEAKYVDIVGLCKAADHQEYANEQDYSLNAGRYVGVEIEGDEISENDFKEKLINLLEDFDQKSKRAVELSELISKSAREFIS